MTFDVKPGNLIMETAMNKLFVLCVSLVWLMPLGFAAAQEPADINEQILENTLAAGQAEALAPPAPAAAVDTSKQLIRVAVYSLEAENIPKGVAQIVTDNLLAEVRKLEGVSAIGMEEIYEMLQHEKSRQVMGCDADDACLAEIAGALGVDELITGKLSSLADGSVMVLRRINQGKAQITATFNERLKPEEGVEFLAAIGDAVKKVYPRRDILPGTQRGVPEEVGRKLSPPPIPTWATYAAGGASLLAGALGGAFGAMALSNQASHNTVPTNTQNLMSADYVAYEQNGRTFQGAANASFISAGILLVTTGVMALFTDWEGYQEALNE